MKLGLKIILPILSLLVIILGVFGYLLVNLTQQGAVISTQGEKIQKVNSLNEQLSRQQDQTVYDVLAYRFSQDKSSLLAISQAERDKSKTLDEMSPFITTSRGKELMNSYIDTRKEVELLRNGLIKAIDEGDQEQISLNYNKWNIQTQNIGAALADLKAYNINSLERTLASVRDIGNELIQAIFILACVVIATVLLLYFYLGVVITAPLIKLARFADEVSNKSFTTTATTTTTTTRKDEIGMLFQAFNTMVGKLKKSYATLEQKVVERTAKLAEKIREAKNAQMATLNVLEDLKIQEEKLIEAKAKDDILVKDLEKFKLAVDNVSDNIIITDPEGIVIYANKAVEKITGYKPEEAIGKKIGVLWKTPMPLEYYQKLWDTIKKQKEVFVGEIQNKRKNGAVYTAAISISPILSDLGEVEFFVSIERDITKEKEIDKAKTEFVSLASHQLRTPLTTISWCVEMLLKGDFGEVIPDQEKYLERIYQGNQRMIELVSALLNVSRIEMRTFIAEPTQTDITVLAQSVLDEQKPEIEKKKLIIIENFSKDVPIFSFDPKFLRMIFQNLLTNAVEYTPLSGRIEFTVSIDKKKTVLVKVSDTGYGIPKNQQHQIFTKFFRADNVKKKNTDGTGLGLYIVKSIVENFGGKIRFESPVLGREASENPGTVFYVTLPLNL